MFTYAQPKAGRQTWPAKASIPRRVQSPALSLGDRLGHNFSRFGVGPIQAKYVVNQPGDRYEQEADRVSEQVMRMEPGVAQRLCTDCDEKKVHRAVVPGGATASSQAEASVDAVGGGQPLTREQRALFEPRFGVDFSRVRIHADGPADDAARSVGALAFTRGSNIVFRDGQYRPHTSAGDRLLAHELTHVVQQGGAEGDVLQCWPGDGMTKPGDCSWATYIPLRLSVESAKVIVSGLGRCNVGDSCVLLATKIAAIGAEVAARVTIATACFKGGDGDHRTQINDKVNMLNRCYERFTRSNCPQGLIGAMAVVVAATRAAIEALAMVAAAALIVAAVYALVVALIALVEAIIAAVAAAAAVVAEAALGALAALLVLMLAQLAPQRPERPSA
ncbi:MAG TPA: DUF4157 domain-containing protein [Thermoanaerobaculia bacterium]|nr:DUF4157 domain-containing protein [Thermoanaerobaculia bacterium]